MKQQNKIFSIGFLYFVFFLFLTTANITFASESDNNQSQNTAIQIRRQQMMMNHGLSMALQGSSMVMISGMNMAPDIDNTGLIHGQQMIKEGKTVLQHAITLEGIDTEDNKQESLISYTQELGKAMLEVVNGLDKIKPANGKTGDLMTMHHMNMLLNHALKMTIQGSNLVTLGQVNITEDIDDFSVTRGNEMNTVAISLLDEVMKGQAMQNIHSKGLRKEEVAVEMRTTHMLGHSIKKVMDLQSKMSVAYRNLVSGNRSNTTSQNDIKEKSPCCDKELETATINNDKSYETLPEIDDISALNQDGQTVSFVNDILPGKISVINFIYTSCTSVCQILTNNFRQIGKALDKIDKDKKVQLISISIDPETDTPQRLKDYAKKQGIDPSRWTLLTTGLNSIERISRTFGFSNVDKKTHAPGVVIWDDTNKQWKRFAGITPAHILTKEIASLTTTKSIKIAAP